MPAWSDAFASHVAALFSSLDRDAFLERYGWVEDASGTAARLLAPGNLAAMPAHEIYAGLDAIKLPKCQIHMTNLGRVNSAEEVIEGLVKLMREPGDFARKYRAGKIPQAGVVTLSQLLTLAQPQRFAIRNAPFTRALAKQIPFYTARALDELGYEEYLDLCRELARVVEAAAKPLGLEQWAVEHRFLLLYAVLVGK